MWNLELGVFVRLNAVQDLLELAELGDALLLLLRLTCFLVRIVKGVVLLSVRFEVCLDVRFLLVAQEARRVRPPRYLIQLLLRGLVEGLSLERPHLEP